MKLSTVGILGLAILASTSLRAIDFTPTRSLKKLERFSIPILTFQSGQNRASYKPPPGWKSDGKPEELILTPPRPPGASMRFLAVEWSAEKSAKLSKPEAETEWALAYVPSGASETAMTATNESPFMLGVRPSREWIFKYRLDGIIHETSVSRCDISGNERVVILVTAPAQEFDTLRQDGFASLFTWEWL